MTKKHFNAAVKIVKETSLNDPNVRPEFEQRLVAKSFVKLFGQFNDKFDEYKFMEACGLVRN